MLHHSILLCKIFGLPKKLYFLPLALRATCNNDAECVDDAYCVQRNSTMGKRCYCRDGFYEEGPMICGGKFFTSLCNNNFCYRVISS